MSWAKTGFEMDQQLARRIYDSGAFLVLLDVPVGTEFGIDCKSWTVAEKFRGVKMIPPGVHFVYLNAMGAERSGQRAPRIGFFHEFKSKELHVRRWDDRNEDLCAQDATDEEVARIEANLRDMDANLAPYPYDAYKRWFSLTSRMSGRCVERLAPPSGRISAQCALVSKEQMEQSSSGDTSGSRVDRSHPVRTRYSDQQGLPIMHVPPHDSIRFTDVDSRHDAVALSASERTRRGMDPSSRLSDLLANEYDGDESLLLGELQFAFATFLLGHVFAGFEQWKRMVRLLCNCREALDTRPKLFNEFMVVLHYQLKECPSDFFVDIVDRDNLLVKCLGRFFSTVEASASAKTNGLSARASNFRRHVTRAFKWDFGGSSRPTPVTINADDNDNDDDRPVVVQLTDAQLEIARRAEGGVVGERDDEDGSRQV